VDGRLNARDDILRAFRRYVEAQTGASFSSEDAETLKLISRLVPTNPE
jgi:hypothetical protein